MRAVKVLIVSNFYPPRAVGGAELVAHRQALALAARGHQIAVFAGRPPKSNQTGGELSFEVVDGVPVYCLSLRSLEPERSFHWEASGRRFRAVLNAFEPDVVHFHNLVGLGLNLALEAKRYGTATVCTVHDHWGYCSKNTLLRDEGYVCQDFEECHFCVANVVDDNEKALPTRLRRDYVMTCLSQVDRLVFPSGYLADAYRRAGFDMRNTLVQSNGVEVERFVERASRSPRPLGFVFVGYLGAHKGLDLLLKAAEHLRSQRRLDGRWRLAIAGGGQLGARVRKFAEQETYREYVQFLGKLDVDEIPSLLAESDVVVLPSAWPENEPVVMLEAIAAGRAQLASRIGGHAELVRDGESGFLFDSGNVDDLIDKMIAYIDAPVLAERHGAFNFARRDAYAQCAAIAAYEKIYASSADRRSPSDTLILCHGAWPALGTAQLFNNFSLFERKKVRFLYSEWADPRLWEQASALFFWSDSLSETLLLRAMRMDIPVVAPAGGTAVRLCEEEGVRVFGYKDFAEAIAALLALSDPAHRSAWRRLPRADAVIDVAAALFDARAYGQLAERPAI